MPKPSSTCPRRVGVVFCRCIIREGRRGHGRNTGRQGDGGEAAGKPSGPRWSPLGGTSAVELEPSPLTLTAWRLPLRSLTVCSAAPVHAVESRTCARYRWSALNVPLISVATIHLARTPARVPNDESVGMRPSVPTSRSRIVDPDIMRRSHVTLCRMLTRSSRSVPTRPRLAH
jgi:hypothetical protein